MLNEEEWRAIRLRAAERCFKKAELLPERIRPSKEVNGWVQLFYWAAPELELQPNELSRAEADYVPPSDEEVYIPST